MIYIKNWRDMSKYGFNVLTGEACGLGYRALIDLSKEALEIVTRTVGAVELKTPSDYNGGDAVGSLLMPYAFLEPLAVFALFMRENVQHVVIMWGQDTYSGQTIVGMSAKELEDSRGTLDENGWSYRVLTHPEKREGITDGMSNVHQMTGRTS